MLQSVRGRLLCVLIAAVAPTLILQAEPGQQLHAHGYVRDFANVLDAAYTQSLDELCYRLEHWTGAEINAITVKSLDTDSHTYVLRIFEERSAFPESGKRRVVILFLSQEQRFTIVAGGEVRPILSDKVWRYQREAAPYLKRHQDGSALALMIRRIAQAIAADAQVGLKEVNDEVALGGWAPVAQPYDVLVESLGAMIVVWLVAIVVAVLVKAPNPNRFHAYTLTVRDVTLPLASSKRPQKEGAWRRWLHVFRHGHGLQFRHICSFILRR